MTTINVPFAYRASPEEQARIDEKIRREHQQALEVLQSLGYSQATVPAPLWAKLLSYAERFQFLNEENRFQVDGKPTEATLLHTLRFSNPTLANHFVATLTARDPDVEVCSNKQPVEYLEDREIEVRHRVLMTCQSLTRVVCLMVQTASIYLGEYDTWHEEPQDGNQATPASLSFQHWPEQRKRRMRLRTEFHTDLLLTRLLLAPYVCRWTDADGYSVENSGQKTAVTTLYGHEAEFELADDSVTLDQLRWLLHQVTDLHVAAQSLKYADEYDGDRIHYEYLDRMTPPDDVLTKMAEVCARLERFKEDIDDRFSSLVTELCVHAPHAFALDDEDLSDEANDEGLVQAS